MRQAWIGLVLPLEQGFTGPLVTETEGVLSRRRHKPGGWGARFLGKAPPKPGYPVPADDAVRILGATHPEAARWWRENVPWIFGANLCLAFDADVCERVQPETSEGVH